MTERVELTMLACSLMGDKEQFLLKCNLPQILIDEDKSLEKVMHIVHNRKKAYMLKDVCLFLFYFIFCSLEKKTRKIRL